MIIFHEGSPGSGKSYDAVVKILANLKMGRKVYTNLEGLDDPQCREMIKCKTGLDDYQISENLIILSRDQVLNFWNIVKDGAFIVIDEMHKFFNSRDWQKEENGACADWCSTHRHYGFDAIFITQRIEKVDTQIRTLTEWTYRYKKVNFFGSFVNKSYICFAYSGDDTRQYLTKKVSRYDSEVFHCYKSYIAKDIKELKIQTHANVLKHPIFFLIPIALIFTVYFMIKSGMTHGNVLGVKQPQKSVAAVSRVDTVKPSQPVQLSSSVLSSPSPVAKPVVPPDRVQPGTAAPVRKATPNVENAGVVDSLKSRELYAVVNGNKVSFCGDSICEN